MATLSHEALRRAVRSFGGCDEYYTEMIHAPSLLAGGRFEKYYLRMGPEPEKLVWQLTGSEGRSIAQAASLLAARGGAGLDLNMGCSAPEIRRSGAGIAWMLKPLSETAAMVRMVRAALDAAAGKPLRLSVKLRLGDEGFTDRGFFGFCAMLAKEGVERVVLHPRTLKEKYRPPPRWDYVRRLAEFAAGAFAVVLNGAVFDAASLFAALAAAPGIEGVMVGRAAAQKPWVFRDLRRALDARAAGSCGPAEAAPEGPGAGSGVTLLETALAFLDSLEECQPEEFWDSRRRRFFEYYCANVRFSHHLWTRIRNAKTNAACRAALAEYFAASPEEKTTP